MSEIQKQCECHGAKSGELVTMPVSVHEADMEREDRKHKRNFIIIIVLIVAFTFANIVKMIYDGQFQDVVTTTETVTQDVDTGDGDATLTGIGDINYGTDTADSNTNNN